MWHAISRNALLLLLVLGLAACMTNPPAQPHTLGGFENPSFGSVQSATTASTKKNSKPATPAQQAAGTYLFDDGAQLGSLSVAPNGERVEVVIEVASLAFDLPYVCRVEFGGVLKKGKVHFVDPGTGEAIDVVFDKQQAQVVRDGPAASQLCGAGAFFAGTYTKFSRRPEADAAVAFVQRELTRLGYYDSGVDGMAGPKTEAALARFKQDLGMPNDGSVFSPQLVEVLLYR